MREKQIYALDRVLCLLEEASYTHLAGQDQVFNRTIEKLYARVRHDQEVLMKTHSSHR